MHRSFTFPREIAVELVKARVRNGLSMIMIPKVQRTETRSNGFIED
jgi:HSP20 family molecular chaperone IbpA